MNSTALRRDIARPRKQTLIAAAVALYNPAQLDVFARAGVLAQEEVLADRSASA
jgi:hypothetical protein